MILLGIETSCDETAAALVEDGNRILASIVASQIHVHHPYGGVVPELASRKHVEAIVPVVRQAIEEADIPEHRIDGIAVTQGPGLVGALLVGFSFAKAYAYFKKIPWIGVDHLQGHVHSVFLESDPPPFPYVALLASGGHTAIYFIRDYLDMEMMGQTRDDAAGEAFDKVSKMLALGYPGGPLIGRMAEQGDPNRIKFPRAYLTKTDFDFSFSGIKTAVNRYIQTHQETYPSQMPDIVAGFQEAVVDVLSFKIIRAAQVKGCEHIAIVGGVAANKRLREKVSNEAIQKGMKVHVPSIQLCGDNAAMIAAVGYHHLRNGRGSKWEEDVYSRKRIS